MNTEELSDLIVAATEQYTDIYFDSMRVKKMDKQLWAALHIGILVGLKACGYQESQINEALEIAQKKLYESESTN